MFEAPAALAPLRLSDVVVTATGTVLVLDSAGRRILRLPAGARQLELVMSIDVTEPVSLAPTGDERMVYLAYRDGVVQLDLTQQRSVPLSAPKGVGLGRFERIRWYRHALVGVQARADGSRRVVRLDLSRNGRRVTGGTVMDASIPAGTGPTFATISGEFLYYLLVNRSGSGGSRASPAAEGSEVVIERVRLR